MSRSNLTDISVVFHHQTDLAIKVSDTGDDKDAVWLPKSAVEFTPEDPLPGAVIEVTLPEPLATEKGLV